MNLGFDLDEVISKTAHMAIDYCNYELGTNAKVEDLNHFWFQKNIFTANEEKQKAMCSAMTWAVHSEDMLATVKPYKNAVKCLNILNKSGHKIYIITKREHDFKDSTATWLCHNNIPFTKLVMTDGNEKGQHIKKYKLDCYVDDCLPNLEEMAQAQLRWRKGLMVLTRPWNSWLNFNPDIITRVNTWQDIIRNIEIGNRLK